MMSNPHSGDRGPYDYDQNPETPGAGDLGRYEAEQREQYGATRLGREVASHILDAFNVAGFGDALAEKVADQVVDRVMLGPESGQGWAREYVTPPWSSYCILGEHDDCNGTAPPAMAGCDCPHHRGEPIPQYGYRLRLIERTVEDYRAEGGGR